MTTKEDVRVRDDAGVRWIELDRPESKNGLIDDVNAKIIAAVEGAAGDAAIRCLVLTGANGNFCSGLDLRAAAASANGLGDVEPRLRKYFHGMIRAIRAIEKPVVALVDGAAVGYGLDLALACDLRIGTERTKLSEVFVRRGLMPDGGGTWTLPRLVGVAKALELMYLGDSVNGEDALRLGLLNRLVKSADAVAETQALARRLCEGPPLAYAAIKRCVYAGLSTGLDPALENEVTNQMKLLGSQDFMEGVAAFFQKRPPQFTGK